MSRFLLFLVSMRVFKFIFILVLAGFFLFPISTSVSADNPPVVDPTCNATTQIVVRKGQFGPAACCLIGTKLSKNFVNYDAKNECVKPLGADRYLSDSDFDLLLGNGEITYAQTCGPDYVSTQDLTTGKYKCYLKKADFVCSPVAGTTYSFNTSLNCCISNTHLGTPTAADCKFDNRKCPNPNYKVVTDGKTVWCAPDTTKVKILSGSFKSADIEGDCGAGGDPDAPTRFIDTAIGCIPVDSLQNTLGFALKWIFLAAGGIIVVMVIKNGFTLLTSSGNPEKLKEVRESVVAIITGVLLIVFSLTILKVVGADILGLPGF